MCLGGAFGDHAMYPSEFCFLVLFFIGSKKALVAWDRTGGARGTRQAGCVGHNRQGVWDVTGEAQWQGTWDAMGRVHGSPDTMERVCGTQSHGCMRVWHWEFKGR